MNSSDSSPLRSFLMPNPLIFLFSFFIHDHNSIPYYFPLNYGNSSLIDCLRSHTEIVFHIHYHTSMAILSHRGT